MGRVRGKGRKQEGVECGVGRCSQGSHLELRSWEGLRRGPGWMRGLNLHAPPHSAAGCRQPLGQDVALGEATLRP